MGKYAMDNPTRLAEFKQKIPKDLKWEMAPPNSNPFHNSYGWIKEGTYPIHCSFIFQVGLTVPFDPLLADFLHRTRFHLGQLTPTVVKAVLGVSKLNKRCNLYLDFDDIRYYYGLTQGKDDGRWAVGDRVKSPSLVEFLGDSHKYSYDNIFIIKGNVEPDHKITQFPSNSAHLVGS